MPKPEIVMSSAFGMGFWTDEEGVFMSCPAFEFGSFDIDNAVPVEDWDDFSVYSKDHMQILAQLVRMCTLKRDYVNICLLYTSPSPRDEKVSRMPSSA